MYLEHQCCRVPDHFGDFISLELLKDLDPKMRPTVENYRPKKITFHAVVFPVQPRDETLLLMKMMPCARVKVIEMKQNVCTIKFHLSK